jgi:hypothetical protein
MDPDIYHQVFHSNSVPPEGNNRGRYANPELDVLLERGRRAVDLNGRRAIYSEVQKIVARELPYIPLWWVKNVIVQQPELRGFVPYPDGDLISLKNVAIDPRSAGTDRGNSSAQAAQKSSRARSSGRFGFRVSGFGLQLETRNSELETAQAQRLS